MTLGDLTLLVSGVNCVIEVIPLAIDVGRVGMKRFFASTDTSHCPDRICSWQ